MRIVSVSFSQVTLKVTRASFAAIYPHARRAPAHTCDYERVACYTPTKPSLRPDAMTTDSRPSSQFPLPAYSHIHAPLQF